jgi:hypothetical protein
MLGQDTKQTYLYLWYPLFQAQWDRCYKLEHVDDISFREITPIILESKCGNRNFTFICSNIQATPAYGVYISQLIQYSRACGSYHASLDR